MNDGRTTEKPDQEVLRRERNELLHRLEDWLETPMVVLAFLWLVLLAVELIQGESLLFVVLGTTIWVVFVLDFAVKFVLAPDKIVYLKGNWLLHFAAAPRAADFPDLPNISATPAGSRGTGVAVGSRR